MFERLTLSYKYIISEARCYFSMAQNPVNPCKKEDCFYAAIAAGKAAALACILIKDWNHNPDLIQETENLIKTIRDYWEELEV